MKELILEIQLESDALIGSGESYGALIDGDVVFDPFGFPYIPAKRIKGCLRDSLEELIYLFQKTGYDITKQIDIESCFGQRFDSNKLSDSKDSIEFRQKESLVHYENLMLYDYENLIHWKHSLKDKSYDNLFSKEAVLSNYTTIRRQTSIDEKTGTAKKTSLRMFRVLKKSLVFQGKISLQTNEKKLLYTLALAVSNFTNLGTFRNRGLGNIHARLKDNNLDITQKTLEELKNLCK